MILLIDNYDSFVHNLARYFQQLGQETRVVRNDAITAAEALALAPGAIVLSPGPYTPDEAGCSLDIARRCAGRIPLLGVCLGHQTLCQAFGARIVRAGEPIHGRTSLVRHDGRGVFAELPNPLTACRYHSLTVEAATLPACLESSARSENGDTANSELMAVRHRSHLAIGLQFHPESILTACGLPLLANFLGLAELSCPAAESIPSELPAAVDRASPSPDTPITF